MAYIHSFYKYFFNTSNMPTYTEDPDNTCYSQLGQIF